MPRHDYRFTVSDMNKTVTHEQISEPLDEWMQDVKGIVETVQGAASMCKSQDIQKGIADSDAFAACVKEVQDTAAELNDINESIAELVDIAQLVRGDRTELVEHILMNIGKVDLYTRKLQVSWNKMSKMLATMSN